MSLSLLRRSSAVFALALLAASCGKGTPAEPTPSPTPTPAAVATPTPVPAPTPVNARVACGVGAGSGDGLEHSCPRSGENFLRQVNDAIDRVVAKSPQIFDLNNQRGDGGYYVKAVNQYYNGVVQELQRRPVRRRGRRGRDRGQDQQQVERPVPHHDLVGSRATRGGELPGHVYSRVVLS